MLVAELSALGTGHVYPRETSVVGITAREAQCLNQLRHHVTPFNDIWIYGTLSLRQLHLQISHVLWFLKPFYDTHAAVLSSYVAYTVFTRAESKRKKPAVRSQLLIKRVIFCLHPSQVFVFNIFRKECLPNSSNTIVLDYIFGINFFIISFIFNLLKYPINTLSSIYVAKIYFKSVLDNL